jgi:hypothetical protein
VTVAELLKRASELARAGFSPAVAIARRLDGLREVECTAADPRAQRWSFAGLMFRAGDAEPATLSAAWAVLDDVAPGGSALLWASSEQRTRSQVQSLLARAYVRAASIEANEVLEPGANG